MKACLSMCLIFAESAACEGLREAPDFLPGTRPQD